MQPIIKKIDIDIKAFQCERLFLLVIFTENKKKVKKRNKKLARVKNSCKFDISNKTIINN